MRVLNDDFLAFSGYFPKTERKYKEIVKAGKL
jgi:hypothetical protein